MLILKKNSESKMNNEKRNIILLVFLDKIYKENPNMRNSMNKSGRYM